MLFMFELQRDSMLYEVFVEVVVVVVMEDDDDDETEEGAPFLAAVKAPARCLLLESILYVRTLFCSYLI